MAAAVEDAEVMLIGVSRAYKESSNCRMEAQYGMQRQKDMIPLMMEEGYDADGWLGMLIGTRLWYGFCGKMLTDLELFESKVEELCRELGERGHGGDDESTVQCESATVSLDVADSKLCAELGLLSLKQLRERALAAGISGDVVEEARDADNAKAALVELLVKRKAEASSSADLLWAISVGSEVAVGVLVPVLEHASDVLNALSASMPRRSRKAAREALDRVESVCESVDISLCDGIAQCGVRELEVLASLLASVQELDVGAADVDSVASVSLLLECLARCGSAVLQSLVVLRSDAVHSESARVSALEVLRDLPREHLEVVSLDEVSAVEVVLGCMGESLGAGVRVSACMALFALGCRNGIAACGTEEFARGVQVCRIDAVSAVIARCGENAAVGELLELTSAVHSLSILTIEAATKVMPSARGPLGEIGNLTNKAIQDARAHVTDEQACTVVSELLDRRMLEGVDLAMAAGSAILYVGGIGAMKLIHEAGFFDAVWALYRRMCPEPLGAEYWSSTCDVVVVMSVLLVGVWGGLWFMKFAPMTHLSSAAWWIPLRDETIRMTQMNASARLSERPTMAFWPIRYALSLLEMWAKDESQHAVLLESGVSDALEYACINDFAFMGFSVAGTGAGVLVQLVGRAEGGKTLSCMAVLAILGTVQRCHDEDHFLHNSPLALIVHLHVRAATMAVSDTNKCTMLEFDGLLDLLVKALLLDSPRRSEAGADGIQEASAEILAHLALFGPGAEALQSHAGAMAALRVLRDGESSTDASHQSAVQALFQLEGPTQAVASSSSKSAAKPKHVMMSYNWDHQPVIKHIHAALVQHGYTVWIDVEQMKGSTVDAMSKAVEDAAVVVFGVSRAYKESKNCRLEAQYAMQREVDTVPLMLVDGYRPDGWLGMLIGTRMWYGFYGRTLKESRLFEGKVEELCRELGERGCGGNDAAAVVGDRPQRRMGRRKCLCCGRSWRVCVSWRCRSVLFWRECLQMPWRMRWMATIRRAR
jgi:hypothetical protein